MQLYNLQNILAYQVDIFHLSVTDGLLLISALMLLLFLVLLYQQILPALYLAQEEVDILNEQESRIKAREYLMRLTEEQDKLQKEVEKEILDDISDFDKTAMIDDV